MALSQQPPDDPVPEHVAGIDGCSGGWLIVRRDVANGSIDARVVRRFRELLEPPLPAAVGIDVPIGLPDRYARGGRACDRAARVLLGRARGASVFPCPARPALGAGSYEEAARLNRGADGEPVGISRQCFNIFPKIREVDAAMTPRLQERVREVHPELSFFELAGGSPLLPSKKTREGRALRLALLERAWGRPLSGFVEGARTSGSARDDVLDAMVVCWTAERVLRGEAISEPSAPAHDSRGLRMEIVR